MANKAAYIVHCKARPLEVREAPMPVPGPLEVVIRVRAVAINPVDAGIQNAGIVIDEYPAVLGVDMAGEISAVGNMVERLRVGDRVLASANMDPGDKIFNGTFQYYCPTDHRVVAKIPDTIAFKDACVLPLAMSTAATALFDKRCIGLNTPRIGAAATDMTVVIWGGASSVGSCAIQMTTAAGYRVVTTCSKKNADYCRDLGAQQVFDYNSPTAVDEIVAYMKGKQSAGVFDAIMAPETLVACNEIAHRAEGHKHVGTVLPSPSPLPEGLPQDVTTSYNWGLWLKDNEVGEAIFQEWAPRALLDGSLKCKPDAKVVGTGLESIQAAIDAFASGISCTKLVVEI